MAVAAAGGGYGGEFRAGAALAVWWAIIVGLVFGVWPRTRVPRSAFTAGGGLVALAGLAALSVGWASDNGSAFAEAVRAGGYAGLFVLVVVAAPAGSASRWLSGLALGLVGISALALGSRMQPSLFPEQDVAAFIPSVATRLSYPLNYWNGLAACMALAVVALVWLSAHGRTPAGRAFSVAAIPAAGLTMFLTSSRGGVAALAVGLAALVALGPARARLLVGAVIGGIGAGGLIAMANAREAFVDGRVDAAGAAGEGHTMFAVTLLIATAAGAARLVLDRPAARLTVPRGLAITAAVVAVAAAGVGLASADLGGRIDDFKSPPADPGSSRGFVTRHLASAEGNGRYQFWTAGIDAFETEPLRGIGAGGYESWWAQHGSLAYFIRDAHSLPVEVLAELGLLGLIALLCFFGGATARGASARLRDPDAAPVAAGAVAVLACGAASAAIDWTWELPAAFAPVVVAAAVLAGPALGRPGPRQPPRFGLGVATLALAWAAVVASVIVLVGETKLGDSRAAARRGDLSAAAEDAAAARAIQPWSGAPYLQLALVRERAGDLPGARDAAADAAARDEGDWRVWLVVARLAVKEGDVSAARAALRTARELNPRSRLFDGALPPK